MIIPMPRPLAIIAVDIGGTKTTAGAIEIGALGAAPQPPCSDSSAAASQLRAEAGLRALQIPTPRANPAPFYDAIAELVRDVRAQAAREGVVVLPLIGVAHPGRFLPDGTLARGTTPNLGETPGAFDGIAPARELSRRLAADVVAENDAIAQMRFGLHALLHDAVARAHLIH